MSQSLHLSPDLDLPIQAVTQTFAILAKRGVGKTYTASVMVEEMLENKLHVVVIDPVGAWWGLRSSADGAKPGYDIVIAGGDHGDIEITPTSGEKMADLIVDGGFSIVIDLSLFRKGEQVKFMTAFAETLYRRNKKALHLVLDEADAFAPQRPFGDEARMLGAMEDIVRRGRIKGLGMTMITQRPAVLNKNVLTQIEVLVALQLTAPLDQKAVKEWVETNAEEGQAKTFMDSISSLPIGNAWFWSPSWLKIFKLVKVRQRRTLDSSKTPEVGENAVEVRQMAKVDIKHLQEALATSEEDGSKSHESSADVKKLQERVSGLVRRNEQLAEEVKDLKLHAKDLAEVIEKSTKDIEAEAQRIRMMVEFGTPSHRTTGIDHAELGVDKSSKATVANDETLTRVKRFPTYKPALTNGLTGAEAKVLMALLKYGQMSRTKAAIISGYSVKSGGYANTLSGLRVKGLIEGSAMLKATTAGQDLIISGPVELPFGKKLQSYWINKMPKAPAAVLNELIQVYPKQLTRNEGAQRTGYSASSGGYSNALSKLRTLELINGSSDLRATDDLFE